MCSNHHIIDTPRTRPGNARVRRATCMDIAEIGGLNELAAACTAEEGSMAVMTGVNDASRKRRRASQASAQQATSVAEHMAALRSRWQGLDRALADSQAQLAERASSVAAREAACAVSERQLAQRLAQLSLHERLLQERAARVIALEHEVQARERVLVANKENAVPLAVAGDLDACCRGGEPSPVGPACESAPVHGDPAQTPPVPHEARPHTEGAGGSEAGASSGMEERSPSCASAPLQARASSGGDSDKDDPPYLPAKLRIKAHPHGAPPGSHGGPKFSKTLDYKSCDHILCLTKDMARYLLPAVPVSAHTGGSTQVPVTVVDESGREWPMTYRCVPHRYSYELRAGWKPFAAFWGVSVGDRVTLAPAPDGSGRILISVTAQHAPRVLPPSGAAVGLPAGGFAPVRTPGEKEARDGGIDEVMFST
ncbi:hypothetical protein WJX81_005463 [Elliptochloris bilobata]|uniref:TF-B3 domain-containing protein n=1 Tax=Elliptochloris bilobata TaxID=381761 RepID=A0AAW1SGI1_9CHLO